MKPGWAILWDGASARKLHELALAKGVKTAFAASFRYGPYILYAKELVEQGVDVANLKGGVLGWAHADGRFVDPQGGRTQRVHVYGQDWDLLPDGYASVR